MKTIKVTCDVKDSLPLDQLQPFQGELKSLDEKAYKQLRSKITGKQGFSFPIFVWQDGQGSTFILDGHQRTRVLGKLQQEGYKLPDIPVVIVKADSYKEAKEKLLSAASQYGKVEAQGLYEFIVENQIEPDFLYENYRLPEINYETFHDEFFYEKPATGIDEGNQDDVPEVDKEKVYVKTGQVYKLGPHRLMCGDSTNPEHADKLMGEDLADLLVTDPPYNVDYVGKTKDALKIKNDKMDDGKFTEFLTDALANAFRFQPKGAPYYIFHADTYGWHFRTAAVNVGYELKQVLQWVKNSMVMGRQDYHWQHEPILYGWVPGAKHRWYSDRKQTTVWNFDRPTRSEQHPTMKPVSIIEYAINNSSKEGDIVLDLFGGSGTTLVAAHKIGRRARLMELDPYYAQTILERWTALGGETPELLSE